ncbi:MAG: thioredoxin [Paludibacteraceae bacterium]|nr:thioredoxin [Paludibacteraceae bacterium]MBR2493329.1 thioredoxin [Paludibacteraceae bacterium]MBR3871114.1 thioredoxin [Paludibacteraceae bacterium]MBR6685776.1 thioredoxin [Paludibacteraceae bacterium]
MAKEFTDANFDELLSSNKVVVADFWATWCGPCKAMGPSIDELATEYEGKALIGKVDVEENNDLAEKYAIRSVPTIIFFKDGEMVDKQVGAVPKAVLESKIKNLL